MRAVGLGFHTGFSSAFVPVSVTQWHFQKFLNKVGQALLLGSSIVLILAEARNILNPVF